jgi:hypothetical protein
VNILKYRLFSTNRGQALVEFLLVAIVLIAASYGASRLIAAAWKSKFTIITAMRCGVTGIGP